MKTSESLIKISKALLDAQMAISFASKDATNPHFKNKYADLPAVIDAIKSPLNDNGIVFMQTGSPSDDGYLHLTTRLMHESGEWIEDTLVMPLPKQDPQGYGSAMTYARRYALSAITGLYQDDDDGNLGSGHGNKAPQSEKILPPRELAKHSKAIKDATDEASLRKAFSTAYKAAEAAGDKIAMEVLTEAKDDRKAAIGDTQTA